MVSPSSETRAKRKQLMRKLKEEVDNIPGMQCTTCHPQGGGDSCGQCIPPACPPICPDLPCVPGCRAYIPCRPTKVPGPKVKVVCGKRPRSREVRGGSLILGCNCEKYNGLQDFCPRTTCREAAECQTEPPLCGPSMYANGHHLEMRYKKNTETKCMPNYIRLPPCPPNGMFFPCVPISPFGTPCGPPCLPCQPYLPSPIILSPNTPCSPYGPCAPSGPIAVNMPCSTFYRPPVSVPCPMCAPCPASPCGPCCGPCIPLLHQN